MTLRVAFVDDEKMARKRLRRLLETLGDVEVVGEHASAEAFLPTMDPASVDVALLDIDMPGVDGLELAAMARRRGVPVIFVTAHEKHAVAAFARGAVHYLLKPVALDALDDALDRVRGRREPATRLALTVGDEVHLVAIAAISHATFDGTLVTVFGDEGRWLSSEPLADLERRLAGHDDFVRVHRRALVSLAHVERLQPQPSGGYLAVMRNGDQVPVARQAARDLRRRSSAL